MTRTLLRKTRKRRLTRMMTMRRTRMRMMTMRRTRMRMICLRTSSRTRRCLSRSRSTPSTSFSITMRTARQISTGLHSRPARRSRILTTSPRRLKRWMRLTYTPTLRLHLWRTRPKTLPSLWTRASGLMTTLMMRTRSARLICLLGFGIAMLS
ncbi:hypothetical protein ATCV1_z766R [Acanthocystis turfacea chlorella virus 1]|uniref:Uncharacterized protein z766R n=1 Tax=Chlorovirus heliozoae TaxID=322019 RepID=A7KA26_9PHYC|nr:hypothetical protein ATCV1_z766R [Acanthocystis turfacea chlorella virus 1]ABT16900.1 hypothetical protein ATCV1_z766R [Acanthocystis turfacea chlorella virus 1]